MVSTQSYICQSRLAWGKDELLVSWCVLPVAAIDCTYIAYFVFEIIHLTIVKSYNMPTWQE